MVFGDGFADAGAATAERTEVIGLVDTIKGQLDGVDAALARITEGKYGICVNCGKEIDPARMEARPESIYCVDCKAKLS
jgi:RNA polymerase-binding transcription factor DksA